MLQTLRIQPLPELPSLDLELGQFNVFISRGDAVDAIALEALAALSLFIQGHQDEAVFKHGPRLTIETKEEAAWSIILDERSKQHSEAVPPMLRQVLHDFVVFAPEIRTLRYTPSFRGPSSLPISTNGEGFSDALQQVLRSSQGRVLVDAFLGLFDWASDLDHLGIRDRHVGAILPFHDACDGALLVLFFLTLVLHPNTPTCFGLKNFGDRLNPRLGRALTQQIWRLVQERQQQVLCSTTMATVLDALPLQDDRVRLFMAQRSEGNTISLERVSLAAALRATQDLGLSLSSAWTRASLVP